MLRRTVVVVLACRGLGLAAQGQPAGATRPSLGVTLTERTFTSPRPARTVVGLPRHRRTLTLVTVDGRAGVSGLTPREIAEILIGEFGVWDALNLDGGGSTTMAWQDPVTGQPALLNTPSDGPAGRRVATSLAVFARPARQAPAP